MKKYVFVIAVASLAMASCKKDRNCHCKTVSDVYDAGGAKVFTTTSERDIVMTKTTRKTAFKACIHDKSVQNFTGGGRLEVDDYCELK